MRFVSIDASRVKDEAAFWEAATLLNREHAIGLDRWPIRRAYARRGGGEDFACEGSREVRCWKPDRRAEAALGHPFPSDPDTGLPHVYGHGVTEAEVEFILRHPGQDRPGRDASRHAMGQTAAGRYLRVIYAPDEQGDGVFVVTAWEMRGNERRSYRRRRRLAIIGLLAAWGIAAYYPPGNLDRAGTVTAALLGGPLGGAVVGWLVGYTGVALGHRFSAGRPPEKDL